MLDQYIANDYLRAFTVLVILFFSIRVSLFIIEKIILRLTKKTKTDLDDKLLHRSSKPISILALLISIKLTLNELALSEMVLYIVNGLIYTLIVIFLAILTYVVVDVLVISGLKALAKKTKSNLDDSIITLFHSVLNIALIVISLLYILELWGIKVTPLLAGLGVAGLAVALALQPILSNIFSGASMIMDQSVKSKDLVYLEDGTKGKVERIGLRSTRIKTFDNELIIIPNNKLADSTIQNVALPEPKTRVVIPFGVAYGSNVKKVKEVVLKEIKTIKNRSKDEDMIIRFMLMADSSINFNAYFYVDSFEHRADAIDEANTKIYDALSKAGIEIPFPQMDVNLKKE
jgi:MscS family membrane protein